MEKEYISMAQAAGLCTYDQEYLSLLARRSLLHAEKIGKKWYTTREWLNDYLRENRPNEIIEPVRESQNETVKPDRAPRIFKWSVAAASAVAVIGMFFYLYTIRRIDRLEQKANDNKFILNEIVRIPDDEGNLNVYGSGMVKIDQEPSFDP